VRRLVPHFYIEQVLSHTTASVPLVSTRPVCTKTAAARKYFGTTIVP
jgi:hypothetical protein